MIKEFLSPPISKAKLFKKVGDQLECVSVGRLVLGKKGESFEMSFNWGRFAFTTFLPKLLFTLSSQI